MRRATRSGIFWTSVAALALVAAVTVAAAPQTTRTAGAPTVATAELKGEVVQVEGSDLVVKLANGEIRTFRVPPSRRFIIDGKELTVHDLKPGTTLTATTTTTTTPVSVRTKSIRTAKVWYAAPPNVILTLPNGENKQYVVKDDVKFTVDGRPATVFDLRKGMTVAVEKIVEEPTVEIAENISVVGHAPAPAAVTSAPKPGAPAASSTPAAGSPPVSTSVPTASSGVAAGGAPPAGGGAAASSSPAAGGGAAAGGAAASSAPPTGGGAAAGTDPAAASSAAQAAEAQAESGTSPLLWVGLIIVLGIIAAFFFRSKAKA